MRFNKRLVTGAAVVISVALLASACGDDDDDDTAGGAATSEPTGPAINIGFVNVENSAGGSYPDLRLGAEAAVEHINKDLGGVNGRPLDLESCIVNGSGESSIGCANKFVQSNKVAVSFGYDYGAAGGVPVLANAGIPLVGGVATEPAQLTSPNSFLFIGGITSAIPGVARYAGETLKAKKVAVLGIDIPAARLAVDSFSKPVLAQLGVTDVSAVYESPTAADWTPALTKANEGNPDAIIILVGAPSCQKVMQGSTQLGIDPKKFIYVQSCVAPAVLEEGGPGGSGVNGQSPFLAPQSDDPQVEEWREALEEFRPDANAGPDTQVGFNSMMNLYAVMKGLPGEITAAAITDALKSAKEVPSFMAHPYTCDGQQVPGGLTAICNANERILTITDGEYNDVFNAWVNGAALLGG